MAHLAAVELALSTKRQLFPIVKDDADFHSALSFVAASPPVFASEEPGVDRPTAILYRDTLALLILKEMSSPEKKGEFNFNFARLEFLLDFSSVGEKNLFRSRMMLSFFAICKDLDLETFASNKQIETLKRGRPRHGPRGPAPFHWSESLVGHDFEEWMAWLLQEESIDTAH